MMEEHDVSDADIAVFLDEAYHHVLRKQDWSWANTDPIATVVPTVIDQDHIVVSGYQRIYTVFYPEDEVKLEMVSLSSWSAITDTQAARTDPRFWAFDPSPNKVYLFPTPSSILSLKVYGQTSPLFDTSTPTSTPPFDVSFHTTLVDWVLHRLWEREEDFEKSDDYRGRFEVQLLDMVGYYNTVQQDSPIIYGDRVRIRQGNKIEPYMGLAP